MKIMTQGRSGLLFCLLTKCSHEYCHVRWLDANVVLHAEAVYQHVQRTIPETSSSSSSLSSSLSSLSISMFRGLSLKHHHHHHHYHHHYLSLIYEDKLKLIYLSVMPSIISMQSVEFSNVSSSSFFFKSVDFVICSSVSST